MSRLTAVGKKETKNVQTSRFYFALKSKNEIYFQMASIFKEISNDKDEFAKNMFKGMIIKEPSNIFLEKSF